MPTSCKIERYTLVFRLVLNVKPQNTEITSRAILGHRKKSRTKL